MAPDPVKFFYFLNVIRDLSLVSRVCTHLSAYDHQIFRGMLRGNKFKNPGFVTMCLHN